MKRIFLIITIFIITGSAKAQNASVAYNNTLSAYFELKNALAKDNVAAAAASAKRFAGILKGFPVLLLSKSTQSEWRNQSILIQKYANEIAGLKDLELQRKSFGGIASPVIKLARAIGLHRETIYVQHCPMVKRSWLNDVEAVQNPFYGSKMYDCGEVTETIAKK